MNDLNPSHEDAPLERHPVEGARAAARRRRTYSSPRLIEWGSLTELTLGGAGSDNDYDFITTKAV